MKKIVSILAASMMLLGVNAMAQPSIGAGYLSSTEIVKSGNSSTTRTPLNGFYAGLSYTLPIRSTYLQGITVWAAANNLFTLTKYLGSDPEFAASNAVIGMGIDRGLMAPGRSFSVGMKINL